MQPHSFLILGLNNEALESIQADLMKRLKASTSKACATLGESIGGHLASLTDLSEISLYDFIFSLIKHLPLLPFDKNFVTEKFIKDTLEKIDKKKNRNQYNTYNSLIPSNFSNSTTNYYGKDNTAILSNTISFLYSPSALIMLSMLVSIFEDVDVDSRGVIHWQDFVNYTLRIGRLHFMPFIPKSMSQNALIIENISKNLLVNTKSKSKSKSKSKLLKDKDQEEEDHNMKNDYHSQFRSFKIKHMPLLKLIFAFDAESAKIRIYS